MNNEQSERVVKDEPTREGEAIKTQPQVSTPQKKAKQYRRKVVSAFLAVVVLCAAFGFGGGWLASWLYQQDQTGGSSAIEEMVDSDGSTVATAEEELISKVADRVSKSVVSIVTSTSSSPFYRVTQQGAGTGIIVSQDGYIMTNNHVVQGAEKVSVVLSDGTEYSDVTIVGSDPLNDIAFVKVEGANDLPAAELGDSSKVRIGQRVVAIGNALGQFQNTVTSGIVSATGRPLVASSSNGEDSESLTDLIQTDTAINSGNSGGPLVDLSGRVIGVNTAVAADANGIGFAIPINATRGVLEGVLEDGKVSRAYLGVRYVDITPAIAASEKLSAKRGAYVVSDEGVSPVEKGSPADKAGIRSKDIITKVNDEVVGASGSLSSIIGQYRPGDKVTLTVQRGDRELKIEVTLAAYDN